MQRFLQRATKSQPTSSNDGWWLAIGLGILVLLVVAVALGYGAFFVSAL